MIRQEVSAILCKARFVLRKWASNEQTILDGIPMGIQTYPRSDCNGTHKGTLSSLSPPQLNTARFQKEAYYLL